MEQKPEFDNSQVKVGKYGYVFFKEVGLWVRPTKVGVQVWKDNINSDDICIKVDGNNNLVADTTQFKSSSVKSGGDPRLIVPIEVVEG